VVRGMEPKIPARRWWELLQLQKQQASSGFDSPAATALTSGSIGLLDACPASTPSTAAASEQRVLVMNNHGENLVRLLHHMGSNKVTL